MGPSHNRLMSVGFRLFVAGRRLAERSALRHRLVAIR